MTYTELLKLLNQIQAELGQNANLDYLLPQEITKLEALPFLPKQSVPYFSRAQALNLLARCEVGIMLEEKFRGQDNTKR